jgi:hypothetical protein
LHKHVASGKARAALERNVAHSSWATGINVLHSRYKIKLDAENEARRKAAELPIDVVLPPSDKTNDRLVDPDAEAKRVRAAKDNKEPVTGTGAATTEPEKPNLWQRIGDIF